MTKRIARTLSGVFVAVTLTVPMAYATQNTDDEDVLGRFQESIDRYVALHNLIERHLPALEISPDAGKIQQAVTARAAALRWVRADAKAGDLFTPDVNDLLRSRIRVAIEQNGGPAQALSTMGRVTHEPESPIVNGTFHWTTASAMPACILAALPELPDELQYRFVGTALVLVDIDADLIVDVMPDAIEGWSERRTS